MRIPVSHHIPTKELLNTLKAGFSNRYSCNYFELGLEPSIIVKKSTWIAAQITVRDKEIELDFTFPTIVTSMAGMLFFYCGIFAVPWLISSWMALQEELGKFLSKRYAMPPTS